MPRAIEGDVSVVGSLATGCGVGVLLAVFEIGGLYFALRFLGG